MKAHYSIWTFWTFVVLSVIPLSSADAQFQPPFFHDDFEDGSVTDGEPVSWSLLPPFDTGTNEIVDGDYVLTPSNSPRPNPAFPNWTEIDSYVDGVEFQEVSLRTQLRAQGSADTLVGYFARHTGDSGIFAYLRYDGLLTISAWDGNDVELSQHSSNLDPVQEDIHLRFDIGQDQASLWAWAEGEDQPEPPQLMVSLPDYIADSGTIGIWNGEPLQGAVRTPVAFRFFEAAPIPEPAGCTLCVFAMLGLIGCARRVNN